MGLSLSIIFCYFLNLICLGLIILTAFQGFYQFKIIQANHPTIAIITLMIYLFTQTFITYFFIAMKNNILEIKEKGNQTKDLEIKKKALFIKSSASRYTYTSILLFIATFTLGGGVHTGYLSLFWHQSLFCLFLPHYFITLYQQHKYIKEMVFVFWQAIDYTPQQLTNQCTSDQSDPDDK